MPVLTDLQELIYISPVHTLDVFWKICHEQMMIGTDGERKSQGNLYCQRDNDYDYLSISLSLSLSLHIYIYILSSKDRSVSFYQNYLVCLDRLDSRSRDRNPVDSNANPRFYHSATRKLAQAREILNDYESNCYCLHIST